MVDGEHQRQGAGGLEQQEFVILPRDWHILRLPRVQVGHHRLHLTGIGGKGLVIKGDKLVGDGVIDELQAEVAPVVPVRQVVHPHIPPVPGVPGHDLQVAAGLAGDIAHPIGDPGGHPDHVVHHHAAVQQGVAHPAGKNRPESSALQHQSSLHDETSFPGRCRAPGGIPWTSIVFFIVSPLPPPVKAPVIIFPLSGGFDR